MWPKYGLIKWWGCFLWWSLNVTLYNLVQSSFILCSVITLFAEQQHLDYLRKPTYKLLCRNKSKLFGDICPWSLGEPWLIDTRTLAQSRNQETEEDRQSPSLLMLNYDSFTLTKVHSSELVLHPKLHQLLITIYFVCEKLRNLTSIDRHWSNISFSLHGWLLLNIYRCFLKYIGQVEMILVIFNSKQLFV